MSIFGGWTRGRRAVASIVTLAIVAGVPITFAVLHNGFPVSDVTLNVKDVWVTNDQLQLAGRLNRQIDELTAGAQADSSALDVIQDGAQVFLHDETQNTLERIERARATLVQKTAVPENAEISLGKTTMSILNSLNGKLWVINVANGLSFDPASTKPDLILGANAHAVVSRRGQVYATSPSKSKLYNLVGAGSLPTSTPMAIPSNSQLSVVGDTPVILAPGKKELITGDNKRISLPGTPLRIQQVGEANSFALVATATGLLEVPLSGGKSRAIEAQIPAQASASDVSAPVWLDGCDYGAFSQVQKYVQECASKAVVRLMIAQSTQGEDLEFRVNQNVIALNDLQNGNTWVLSSKLKLVNNWDQVRPPQESKTTKGHQKTTQDSFEDTLAHRTAVNHPPIARPDQYGVRPGRTTILPVLDNDSDQDGDVLVISSTTAIPKSYGRIDEIDGGRALQFTPTSDAVGAESFHYTIDDGRGLSADTTVNLSIVAASENHAPKAIRQASTSVETGQSITYDVLADWQDPDGDDLVLKAATPASADSVQFTPDGFITFKADSSTLGNKTVNFTVSDGRASANGKLIVDVKTAGALDPIGTPDFAQVFTGKTTVIQPLLNDLAPDGKTKRLVSVSTPPSSATVATNLDTGTVSVSSVTAGVIYLTYDLMTGDAKGEGIIRIDVVDPPNMDLPPIAVKDVAYLRSGQPTTVKVLSNDVSPEGKVLSVQSVDTDNTDPSVKVELLNNTVVRISAPSGLAAQTQFTYTISDGQQTSVAGVTIVPVPPVVNRQPPIAVDDPAVVRAGDIVSVNVLSNDYSPDNDQLFLEPQLVDTSDDGGGLAFVNGTTVRYQAPTKAGQYSVVYRTEDQYGESATAHVNFQVTAIDKATDRAPVPATQTARAFAGQTIRVNVPLDNIDPDGDSSFLTTINTPPGLGSIVGSGPTWFDYKASEDSEGTDSFTYNVADTFGKVGVGEIDVGIIPRPTIQAAPNAVNDNVDVKPGKEVSVQVLLNDSDPSGYKLTLLKKLTGVSPVLTAHVTGDKVIVGAPKKVGAYSLRYTISNGHGGVDSALVNVRVTPLAKPIYPTATDDYIASTKVHGTDGIKVDIESLIDNPNGDNSDLLITSEGPNAERANISQVNGTITVVPEANRYAVAYRVTDPTDKTLTATAFIVVPPLSEGTNILPPSLKTTLPLQVVKMNSFRTWKLSSILTVPSGKPAILTSASNIHASHTDGSSAYVDKSTIRFTAAKGYRGPAYITFQVTDGSSATDPNGRVNYVTMPIRVGDANSDDVAPTFTKLKVQIQPGEAARKFDLRQSTGDPNRALISSFQYTGLTGATPKITAGLSGPTLSISSPLGVQPGATAVLRFSIKYKNFTVPGEVDVLTVSSTRPLAETVPDATKGQAQVPITYNVLANDINPYADVNKPLTLTGATVTNGATASVSFNPNGEVTVSNEQVGYVDIQYTVRDASQDPTRDVQGQYVLNVRDVPSKMSPPTIVSESDKAVTVSWQAPSTNGEPIDQYEIVTSGGIAAQYVDASAASTTISGLTNGNNYTFQVKAENVLGYGTISDASATAIPYGKPGKPSSPSITATSNGSGNVSMTWGAADGNGRSVSSYTWTLSNGTSGTTSNLSANASGKVGTAYTFSVVATNPAGDGAAATSGSATPRPGAPSSATTSVGGAGDSTVTMTWGTAASTQAISNYQISVNGGSWSDQGTSRSYSFSGAFGTGYSFAVRAVSAGQTSDTTTSNTATPQAPPAASATIVGKGANSTCSDGGSGCNPAIVRIDNIVGGTYNVSIQEMNSAGTVVFSGNPKQCSVSSGGQCTSGGYLGLLPSGDTMRVHIYGGPSGTIYSNTLDRNGWKAV